MKDFNDIDLADDPDAVQVCKRAVDVSVEFAARAGSIETLEGEVAYRKGDAILTGTAGDRWPVERHLFLASYKSGGGQRVGDSGIYRKLPQPVWARRMAEEFTVTVGHSKAPLQGKSGDWLVQYSLGHYGIVSREIFSDTYDIVAAD